MTNPHPQQQLGTQNSIGEKWENTKKEKERNESRVTILKEDFFGSSIFQLFVDKAMTSQHKVSHSHNAGKKKKNLGQLDLYKGYGS